MDRFVARQNVRQFHDKLLSDVGPEVRATLQALLVAEEDKLGQDLELLADIERHLAECGRRIAAQQARVDALKTAGQNGVARAQAFLDGMRESHSISLRYHRIVAREIARNRLLDR